MSLTSFLSHHSDVKKRFRQEFPKPKLTAIERQTKMLAPPISNRYALVGTAFDYLLRFYLQRINPNSKTQSWIAEESVNILLEEAVLDRGKSLYRKGEKIVSDAKMRLSQYLETGQLDENLIESALLLAQLDAIFRQGTGHEQIGLVHSEDLQDLKQLISIVPANLFKAQQRCVLNPTFGEASIMVGGADADFIVDDLLVDIKTTKYLEIKEEYFYQLLGYYTLHILEKINQKQYNHQSLSIQDFVETKIKQKINKVAIYFSRHAYLKIFELNNYINPNTFSEFVRWFEQRARQIY